MPKTIALGLIGGGSALGSVVLSLSDAMKSNTEWGLRMLTLLLGLFIAVLSAYWTNRINRVKLQREKDKLCDWCRAGHRPAHCPISEAERPKGCPKEYRRTKH